MKSNFKHKIFLIEKESKHFPKSLKILKDCPDILFVIGNIEILNDRAIAIVGSRKCSEYGKNIAYKFAKEISDKNIRVVSGLAEGIDTYAHRGAINNKTIAIIGSGFNNIYPKSNSELVDEIIKNGGAVVTEYFFDVEAFPFNFPKRNRLVAAMSSSVLVVEATKDSGALITANLAKKFGKELYSIPTNIDNLKGLGSNLLISNCIAKACLSSYDILKNYIDKKLATNNVESKIISNEYEDVYKLLQIQNYSADEISKLLKIPIKDVNTKLTIMELKGYIFKENNKFSIK